MDDLGEIQLRVLLAATPLAVAACDADGWLTVLSPSLQALVGPVERVHASQFVERFGLRDRDGAAPLLPEDVPLSRALRGENVRGALLTAQGADDRLLYLRTDAAPVTAQDGEIVGAVALVHDITDEHAAGCEREELRTRLVDTVNHEFRTPLTKLLGHAELLQDVHDRLAPQAQHSLEMITQAAQDLARLVRTVSELTDLEAQTRLAPAHVDLAGLLRDAVSEARLFLPQQGQHLMVECPKRLTATLDPNKVKRAVTELLHNAAVYGPPDTEIVLRLTGDNDTVEVTVIDAGSGISPQERARLIQPFQRGSHPRPLVNSKGLGLAIAYKVATAHGGTLKFADRHPHGFSVTMRLPRHARGLGQ